MRVTQTISYKYSKNKNSCFPAGCADTAAEDGRRGSNVYEVNKWLWQFARGKPRLGCLTIKESLDRQESAHKASDKRQNETRKAARVMVPEMKCELDLYEYVLVQTKYVLLFTQVRT
jgi:hypothetical protein